MARTINFDFVLMLFVQSAFSSISSHPGSCTTVPDMCFKLIHENYTHMRLPNMLNHTRKEDVAGDLSLWNPLLQFKECNAGNQLKYFLCFTYAPVCVDNKLMDKFIPPCKSMCQSVRTSCEPVMRRHNYSWPAVFNCDQKHRFYDDASQMCINMKVFAGIHSTKSRKTSQNHDKKCSCKRDYKTSRLKSLICKSHFAFRANFASKPVKQQGSKSLEILATDLRMLNLSKSNKPGLIRNGGSLKMILFNDKDNCRCHRLQTRKRARGYYVVIGRKHRGVLQIDAVEKWKDFPGSLKKPKQC